MKEEKTKSNSKKIFFSIIIAVIILLVIFYEPIIQKIQCRNMTQEYCTFHCFNEQELIDKFGATDTCLPPAMDRIDCKKCGYEYKIIK